MSGELARNLDAQISLLLNLSVISVSPDLTVRDHFFDDMSCVYSYLREQMGQARERTRVPANKTQLCFRAAHICLKQAEGIAGDEKEKLLEEAYKLFGKPLTITNNKYGLAMQAKMIVLDHYSAGRATRDESLDVAQGLLDQFSPDHPLRQRGLVDGLQRLIRRERVRRGVDVGPIEAQDLGQGLPPIVIDALGEEEDIVGDHPPANAVVNCLPAPKRLTKKQSKGIADEVQNALMRMLKDGGRDNQPVRGGAVAEEGAKEDDDHGAAVGAGGPPVPHRYNEAADPYIPPHGNIRTFNMGGYNLIQVSTSAYHWNCWAYSMGTSRPGACNLLLDNTHRHDVRELVGNQIYAAFIRRDLDGEALQLPASILNDPVIQKLDAEREGLEGALKAAGEGLRAAVGVDNYDQLLKALPSPYISAENEEAFRKAYKAHADKHTEFRNSFNRQDVFEKFVRDYVSKPGNAMEFQYTGDRGVPTLLDAIALLKGFQLKVYMEDNDGKLVPLHQTAPVPSDDVRRIMYSHQGMHFSLLNYEKIPEGAAQEEEGHIDLGDIDMVGGSVSSVGDLSDTDSDIDMSLGGVDTSYKEEDGVHAVLVVSDVPPRKEINEHMPKIRKMFNEGKSYTDIARKLKLSHTNVMRWCKKSGLSREAAADRTKRLKPLVLADQKAGLTCAQIVEKYSIPRPTVYRWMNPDKYKKRSKDRGQAHAGGSRGVKPLWRKKGKRMTSEEKAYVMPLVQQARRDGFSLDEIKVMYGIPGPVSSKWCQGIETQKEKERKTKEGLLKSYYHAGMTPKQMFEAHGEELGMDERQVRSTMNRLGMKVALSKEEQQERDAKICDFRREHPWLSNRKILDRIIEDGIVGKSHISAHIVREALKKSRP